MAMKYRVLDIETTANPQAVDWLDPVKPDARLVDPVKIAASIAEKTAERNEKLALDWDCCRIVALGYVDVGGNEPICDLAGSPAEEAYALGSFWRSYRQMRVDSLVTFNGLKFDLPVLLTRSIDLGVEHPKLNLNRFKTPHVDVWQWLTRDGARQFPHSLSFYARKYGFTTLDKVDGKDIAALVAAGEWEKVREHCLSDVGLTHALAMKFGLLEA